MARAAEVLKGARVGQLLWPGTRALGVKKKQNRQTFFIKNIKISGL
jgi:hypothetical protein